MTSNYLYVDPDGLDKISGPYEDAAQNFIRLSAYLSDLRGRYTNAWGNDDLGQKVSPQVQQALRTLQDQVDALGKALGVYGEGLRTTSHAYREADSNADDAATQFRTRTERIAVDMPPAVSGEAVEEPRVFMRSSTPAERLGQRVEGVPLQPRRLARRLLQTGEEGYVEPPVDGAFIPASAEFEPRHYLAARVPVEGVESEEFSESTPLMPGLRVRAQRIPAQPAYEAEPGIPAEPLSMPTQRAFYTPAQRVEAEPLEPVYAASENPLIPAEPVFPAYYRAAQPGIPAEPVEPLPEA